MAASANEGVIDSAEITATAVAIAGASTLSSQVPTHPRLAEILSSLRAANARVKEDQEDLRRAVAHSSNARTTDEKIAYRHVSD